MMDQLPQRRPGDKSGSLRSGLAKLSSLRPPQEPLKSHDTESSQSRAVGRSGSRTAEWGGDYTLHSLKVRGETAPSQVFK